MSQCLKPLVAYVPKYHWGIQTTCNILLQLGEGKQDSVISGVHIFFFTSNSIFGVNVRVASEIYVFKVIIA